ncbi:beta-ketoacyl-[acyl-carrier-protein] synthase family protein [Lentzea tibetensis]|uniref:Beta-ketoacyl-[acyl-carrier-protein] synthase family protein n=1 Tax=Lentzea tibetensis TaxID=2591470 RepID=A0A563F2Z4_9PSEU|nr:beta-ketoacyl-[acyl-carrier-protein] synthase family protein [Lentzea tibetensis]TWP54289.1 beta-ketoacyl-[acyl-carrier-protein] synthase family protein [Lentzea tibetensis]
MPVDFSLLHPSLPPLPGHDDSDVVVTGLGMSTPQGGDVASTWSALLAGTSGVRVLDEPWSADLPVRLGAPLFSEPSLDRVAKRRMDRCQQLAVVVARQAWADAGTPEVEPARLAVVFGTGLGGGSTLVEQYDRCRDLGPDRVSPFTVTMLMPNGPAAVVSMDLGARGGAHAPTSACASGAEAIALGSALLRRGLADVVVTGGTEACLGKLSIAAFARMGALSKRHSDPAGASRPFEASRDGFVMAEGAGALVLERGPFARARGARVYARLAGTGMSSDAHDMTAPSPAGQIQAMQQAIRAAGLSAYDIAHVNAHAPGTPVGDRVEAAAILDALGPHPLVSATKSVTGHLIGGAGAVEAIFTVLAVQGGVVPPTRNLDEQDPDVKLEIVTSPRRARIGAAISNSFGFGGHNVVLAFTRSG